MKLCFLCDAHLSFDKRAPQYRVLEWALADAKQQNPDAILFAGDAVGDGNLENYRDFMARFRALGIPFFYVPGNSDLRDAASRDDIFADASPLVNDLGGIRIFALNDADATISDEAFAALDTAKAGDVVFMHHPIVCHPQEAQARFLAWKKAHVGVRVFYAHEHFYALDGDFISLPALDPDKCIGEEPALLYYDTETRLCTRTHFPCPLPADLRPYLGFSAYRPAEEIALAVARGVRHLELRPNARQMPFSELAALVEDFLKNGGETLSVHLPDVSYQNGIVTLGDGYEALVALGIRLGASRFIQHVPQVSVKAVAEDHALLDRMASAVADALACVPYPCTVAVENMHMTASETVTDRRFGYTPEETLAFMHAVASKTKHRVGINFDIGHARNNAPFSQKYQIGTWMSMLGEHIVSYHLHQVTREGAHFENHTAFTSLYGELISLASFFSMWANGTLPHVPCILEMRPDGAYAKTLDTFS